MDRGGGAQLRAPFPWFGGKRRVADIVWARFGDVPTYNEPFAGSLAVLLGRPSAPRVETVNDLDCYLANFWRALQHDPDAVAYYADSTVNETDLHARHQWLVKVARSTVEQLAVDPDCYDAKIAGWWVWGQCLWIGSGWCQSPTNSPGDPAGETAGQRRRPHLTVGSNDGIMRETNRHANGADAALIVDWMPRPDLHSAGGQGIHRKRFASPGNGQGTGVHRRWQGGGQGGGSGVHAPRLSQQLPQLSGDAGAVGRGIHRKLPTLTQGGNDRSGNAHGILSGSVRSEGLYEYLYQLARRLRRVRVCCGDWQRVLTPSVTTYIGPCGVFLDPPYAHEFRARCYSEDHDISADVRAWALEHGENPDFRIALCGYAGEHLMPASWECVQWKAHGGYSRTPRGIANRGRERVWFSPHCLRSSNSLFSDENNPL